MRHLTPTLLSTFAAAVLLGMSASAGADSTMGSGRATTSQAYSLDLRDSVYQLARDHDTARREPMAMSASGQAGRAGPETVPMGKTHSANVGDTRFSIYDQPHSASW